MNKKRLQREIDKTRGRETIYRKLLSEEAVRAGSNCLMEYVLAICEEESSRKTMEWTIREQKNKKRRSVSK